MTPLTITYDANVLVMATVVGAPGPEHTGVNGDLVSRTRDVIQPDWVYARTEIRLLPESHIGPVERTGNVEH